MECSASSTCHLLERILLLPTCTLSCNSSNSHVCVSYMYIEHLLGGLQLTVACVEIVIRMSVQCQVWYVIKLKG